MGERLMQHLLNHLYTIEDKHNTYCRVRYFEKSYTYTIDYEYKRCGFHSVQEIIDIINTRDNTRSFIMYC